MEKPKEISAFKRRLIDTLGIVPETKPLSALTYSGESKIDSVTLKQYEYFNGFEECISLTVAEPDLRGWAEPVVAIHQTNFCGRKEVFGQAGNPFLAYGLFLAKRGHRVFGIDSFLTGERQPNEPWNTKTFYGVYPNWSPIGKEVYDIKDLCEILQRDFQENCDPHLIGHSHGGLISIFFASMAENVSSVVANASYFGREKIKDPWNHCLYRTGLLNPNRRELCLAECMDLLIASAAQGNDLLLVNYIQDSTIPNPVPTEEEIERINQYSNHRVNYVNLDLDHTFPQVIQDYCGQFIEIPSSERKPISETNIPQSQLLRDANTQLKYLYRNCEHLLNEKESQRNAAEENYKILCSELNKRVGIKGGFREILRCIHARVFPPVQTKLEPYPLPWKPLNFSSIRGNGKIKVLVLSHLFPHPEQLELGPFILEQVQALRKYYSLDIRVLVGRPYWIRSKNPLFMWRANKAYEIFYSQHGWWDLNGVPVRYVPYKIVSKFCTYGWMYKSAMVRVAKEIQNVFPFELVHAHTGYLDGAAGLEIAKKYNVPLVITEHTGPFSLLTQNPITKYITLNALGNADKLIAVSNTQKKNIEAHFCHKKQKNIEVIPNGVDLGMFYPSEKWSPNLIAPRLLFVGHLDQNKNVCLLIDAFALVHQKIPDASLKLIGKATTIEERTKIEDQIKQYGIQRDVRIMGFGSREFVARAMRDKCDIFIMSSHTETFGVVLIEALASGRPVISTRSGGPEDIITDSTLGILTSEKTPQALSAAIFSMIQNLSSYDPKIIRKNVVDRFAYQKVANFIYDVYREILQNK